MFPQSFGPFFKVSDKDYSFAQYSKTIDPLEYARITGVVVSIASSSMIKFQCSPVAHLMRVIIARPKLLKFIFLSRYF